MRGQWSGPWAIEENFHEDSVAVTYIITIAIQVAKIVSRCDS